MCWVRGHAGNTGNELADHLAKTGAGMGGDLPQPPGPVSHSYKKKKIKKYFDKIWKKRWKDYPQGRQSKIFLTEISRKRSKTMPKLSQKQLTNLAQFTTGHGFFRGHMNKWDQNIDKTCKICQQDGSVEEPAHLWAECTALNHLRGTEHKADISNIINFMTRAEINDLIEENRSTSIS